MIIYNFFFFKQLRLTRKFTPKECRRIVYNASSHLRGHPQSPLMLNRSSKIVNDLVDSFYIRVNEYFVGINVHRSAFEGFYFTDLELCWKRRQTLPHHI